MPSSKNLTPTTAENTSGISPKASGAGVAGAIAGAVVSAVLGLLASHHGQEISGVANSVAVPLTTILATFVTALLAFLGAYIPRHITTAEKALWTSYGPLIIQGIGALVARVEPKVVTQTVAAEPALAPAVVDIEGIVNSVVARLGAVGPNLAPMVRDGVTAAVPPAV